MKQHKIKIHSIVAVVSALLVLHSCVQKEHEKTVTFKVDMGQVEHLGNVGLRGQFTSPPWEVTLPMTDENQDGVYEITVTRPTAQHSVEFKFVNQNKDFELPCQPNRRILFQYKPEIIEYTAKFNNPDGKQKTKQ